MYRSCVLPVAGTTDLSLFCHGDMGEWSGRAYVLHATIRQECIIANEEDERSYLREEFRGAAFRGGLR